MVISTRIYARQPTSWMSVVQRAGHAGIEGVAELLPHSEAESMLRRYQVESGIVPFVQSADRAASFIVRAWVQASQ